MKKIMAAAGLLLAIGGCAVQPCTDASSAGGCRAERLLYQNDLMQAKMLIAIGDESGFELADALLKRSAPMDEYGEIEFYQAMLLIRQGPQPTEVLRLLKSASEKHHPHAIALLYKIYQEPFLIDQNDTEKAESFRKAYSQLDVAQSGYPSFDKALALVSELVKPPPLTEPPAPCPTSCKP